MQHMEWKENFSESSRGNQGTIRLPQLPFTPSQRGWGCPEQCLGMGGGEQNCMGVLSEHFVSLGRQRNSKQPTQVLFEHLQGLREMNPNVSLPDALSPGNC